MIKQYYELIVLNMLNCIACSCIFTIMMCILYIFVGTDRMIVSSTLEYIQASGYDCWKLKIGGSGVRCIKCEI